MTRNWRTVLVLISLSALLAIAVSRSTASEAGEIGQEAAADTAAASTALSWTTSATPLPKVLNEHGAAVWDDRIYVTGGNSGSYETISSDVYYSQINADGTLSAWTPTTSLPGVQNSNELVAVNNTLYLIGEGTSTTNVKRASILSDGSVGSQWTAAAGGYMSHGRIRTAAVTHGDDIYVLGGWTGSSPLDKVARARTNPDGSYVSPGWQGERPLPHALHAHAAAVLNGYIYVLGGVRNLSTDVRADVVAAEIMPDGSLGPWNSVTSLPIPMYSMEAVAFQGKLYVIGGSVAIDSHLDSVYAATPLNDSSGGLGSWQVMESLPAPRTAHNVVTTPSAIVSLGGGTTEDVFITGTDAIDCDVVTQIPPVECEALVALYQATGGANWHTNSGWLEATSPCNWYGVTCSNGHVVTLGLGNNQLTGSIPSELGNLTNLRFLYLDTNQLGGVIPPQIGELSELRWLFLLQNQLSGHIPPELGNMGNLQYLELSENNLSGNIPAELGNLSNLQELSLSANQLSGTLPSELGALGNLANLYLRRNQLSGSIPLSFTSMEGLQRFWFNDNDLCEPSDPAFQSWLMGVESVSSTNTICPQNVTVSHIEVTQAIQDEANAIPLVAGKPTFVRVYVDCGEGCDKVKNVTGTLHVSGPGPADDRTLEPVNGSIIAYHPAHWRDQRADLRKTLNFFIPKELSTGDITVTATVGDHSLSLEPPLASFREALPISVWYVPIQAGEFQPDMELATGADRLAKSIFPTHSFEYEGPKSTVTWNRSYATLLCSFWFGSNGGEALRTCQAHNIINVLTNVRRKAQDREFVFGWLPAELDLGGSADANWEWNEAVNGENIAAFGTTYEPGTQFNNDDGENPDHRLRYGEPQHLFAHEIGHLLGLDHTNTPANAMIDACMAYRPSHLGSPDNPFPWEHTYPTIQEFGLDGYQFAWVLQSNSVIKPPGPNDDMPWPASGPATFDLMSYCGSSDSLGNVWISPDMYKALLPVPQTGQTSTPMLIDRMASQNYLVISGMVSDEDVAFLEPITHMSSDEPLQNPLGSEYCLEAQDENGGVVSGHCFDLTFTVTETIGIGGFNIALVNPGGIEHVVLRHGNLDLAVASASENAPQVSLNSPNGGEIWSNGLQTISWSAADEDQGELFFTVEYSPNGSDWATLGSQVTDYQLVVDASGLAGSNNAQIRVQVSDGFNVDSDTSDAPFTVQDKAPEIKIVSPQVGSIAPETPVLLNAYIYDLEDGILEDSALSWHSDQEGNLGTGNSWLVVLSPGTHVLTATVSDSDGNSSSATHEITVGVESQQIQVEAGWNMLSAFVAPQEPAMDDVFPLTVRQALVLCKDNDGNTYWPEYAIDQIEYWEPDNSYQCYASDEFTMEVVGPSMDWGASLVADAGWNMIAYWRDTPMPVDQALSSLGSNLVIAKTGDGKIYWPEFGINTIGDMQPGQGYKLNLNAPATLIYPSD